jgi:hypothetical protein
MTPARSSSTTGTPRWLLRASLVTLLAATAALVPVAWAAKPKARALSATAQLVRTAKPGPLATVQAGTIRGTPFGSGHMTLRSSLKQATVTSSFTLTTSAGRVTGRATARLTLDGDTAHYKGTASITGGSARYRRAKATNIRFTGIGPVSGKSTKITLTGRVQY